MLLNIVIILFLIFISLKIEKQFKIASPLTLMVLSIGTSFLLPNFLSFTNTNVFAEEMLVFIVLLVLGDAFILKLKDLKENYLSILYLAGISVAVAIILGALSKELIFSEIDIGIGALITLFAMVTATDPVSVVTVFNQYKLPHKLKILAEGESLFNDAMALTLFSAFGLYLMKGHELTLSYSLIVSSEIFIGSTIIGIFVGFIGLLLLKTTKDLLGEFILILLVAYSGFLISEHIHIIGHNHLSGLLAEIVAVLTMTTLIDKSYKNENLRFSKEKELINNKMLDNSSKQKEKRVNKLMKNLISDITDIKRQQDVYKFINVISLLANGVLFVSLAHIIEFESLNKYWFEILSVFALTTVIRMVLIGVFATISYQIKLIPNIDFKWYSVLLFAGIKGGLSIVMLHMLNIAFPSFEYKEMFESIVIGVILLSTFIYVPLMMFVIKLNEESFINEMELEHNSH